MRGAFERNWRINLELQERRLAVLIDAENISIKYVKVILDEVSNYGIATYKRAYGDWTNPVLKGWKDEVLKNSITPMGNATRPMKLITKQTMR